MHFRISSDVVQVDKALLLVYIAGSSEASVESEGRKPNGFTESIAARGTILFAIHPDDYLHL